MPLAARLSKTRLMLCFFLSISSSKFNWVCTDFCCINCLLLEYKDAAINCFSRTILSIAIRCSNSSLLSKRSFCIKLLSSLFLSWTPILSRNSSPFFVSATKFCWPLLIEKIAVSIVSKSSIKSFKGLLGTKSLRVLVILGPKSSKDFL